MNYRIEVTYKPEFFDAQGHEVLANIQQLGIHSVTDVQSVRLFFIGGDLTPAELDRIAAELLADPVNETYVTGKSECSNTKDPVTLFEVHLQPGVTDPVAESATMAIADMGIQVDYVRTGRKYFVTGSLSELDKQLIANKILANDCIETVMYDSDIDEPEIHIEPYQLKIITVPLRDLDNEALLALSKQNDLFLNLKEMQTIQSYFCKLGRDPIDVELEMLAQTWSEHCVHKTFRGTIELTTLDAEGNVVSTETVQNILKSYIAKATFDLNKPWTISVFEDNAGVVEFDEDYAVCFKVETHNHPSAIEPYGGAATGIGGCIRDPMGTGLGAKPIANTDIFCFAPPDMDIHELPAGVLHPRRVMKGVVSGVRDYGNRMGIPTVNGAVLFDDRYLGNPLVYCGNIGIMPRDKCFGEVQEGCLIMVVGGRTGRDGIHGATFSSGEMTHEHEDLFSHAVQIGNAITEKKVLDTLLKARDEGLYVAVTDCGAGGLSSAIGEMGSKIGAVVDLEKVPLKYDGLSYTEIWISEAQERMVIAVPQDQLERIQAIFTGEDVEATVIGVFGNQGKLELRYEGQTVGQLDMEFLHEGLPRYTRKAIWRNKHYAEPELEEKTNYNDELAVMLGDYNVASKEWIIRQYDHEVQGGSSVKPLVGIANDGPGDAAVVRPRLDKDLGLAIGCGICPQYSDIDPYWMAMAAIDEAVRNVICVGGRYDRIAILDNFCWGNCDKPDRLAGLVRAARGCYDGAMAYETPFVSGKDSLNNEFKTETGETISIPGTLLISAMTLVNNVNGCVTMDLKKPGNLLVVVGETRNELGGSLYYRQQGQLGGNVPRVDTLTGPAAAQTVARAISQGLVLSCHDCSEGGLAVALAEMAFAGGLGLQVELEQAPAAETVRRVDQLLFSETPSRYLLEIDPQDFDMFACLCGAVPMTTIGQVDQSGRLVIRYCQSEVVNQSIETLKEKWQAPLNW